MEFSPDTRTRTPYQQASGFSAVAERQHEQSRAAVLPALRVANHGATAVIDLSFLSRRGENDPHGLWRLRSAKLANKTLHGLVAMGKAVIGNQVLPDGHGIPVTTQSMLDQLAIRFAGAIGRLWMGRCPLVSRRCLARVGGHLYGRFCLTRVGGHHYGRFCRRSASPPRQAHHHPS